MNASTAKGGKGYKRVYEEAISSDSDMEEPESSATMEVEEPVESDDGM